jgi:hypothetical protein
MKIQEALPAPVTKTGTSGPVDIGPTRGGTYRATGFRRLEWLKAT